MGENEITVTVYESDMKRHLSEVEFQSYMTMVKAKERLDEEFAKVKHAIEHGEGKAVSATVLSRISSLCYLYNFCEEEDRHWIGLVRKRKKIELARPYVLSVLEVKLEDARRMLDDYEYGRFVDSIDHIALYYGEPGRVPNGILGQFTYYNEEVQHRLREEHKRKLAKEEWSRFRQGFTLMLTKVQTALRQSKADFPLVLNKMERVRLGYSEFVHKYSLLEWERFEFKIPTKDFIDDLIRDELNQKAPTEAFPYVTWETRSWNLPLPKSVEYLMLGTVSCLVFGFDSYIVAEATVRVREGDYDKTFYGYRFDFSLDAVRLGFILTEAKLYEESFADFITPLVLLAGLTTGKMEPDGTRIISRSSGSTVYEVIGFEEEVTITDGFLKFITECCQGQSLSQGLLSKGLVDGITAKIIERCERLHLAAAPPSEPSGALSMYTAEELLGALARLGFSTKEAEAAIRALDMPKGVSLEETITFVLKHIGRKA